MNNDSLDVLSGVAVGVFLLVVVVKGNSNALVNEAKADVSFLPWAIAVGILFYLRSVPDLKGPVTELIGAAFIGLFLLGSSKIIPQAKSFWQSIGG
jgi:RsiW-degrading membrane proteinase PrsW (M82 family)